MFKLLSFSLELPLNLSADCNKCITSWEPTSLDAACASVLFMQLGSQVCWQLESDATHRRARGANYVCDSVRLESECRCPIQTSSSAAETTGEKLIEQRVITAGDNHAGRLYVMPSFRANFADENFRAHLSFFFFFFLHAISGKRSSDRTNTTTE